MRIGTHSCWDWGKAQDTLNICCMLVTLDVSRLSGWLNTESCRFEMGPVGTTGERGAGRDTQLLGLGRAQEHTTNILLMFVTLDVSRLSGWLNATELL